MSSLLVAALVVVALASNVYWWRRQRATERALTTSLERDRRVADGPADGPTPGRVEDDSEARVDSVTVRRAAEAADCPPVELPDRIETLRANLADCETDRDRLRDSWARSWWDALGRDPAPFGDPHVLTITLPNATTGDVQAFADHAGTHSHEVALVVAPRDGAFAVSVGEELRETFAADDIAAEISAAAGGGSGGDRGFATGGGADADSLEAVIEETGNRIRRSLENAS